MVIFPDLSMIELFMFSRLICKMRSVLCFEVFCMLNCVLYIGLIFLRKLETHPKVSLEISLEMLWMFVSLYFITLCIYKPL